MQCEMVERLSWGRLQGGLEAGRLGKRLGGMSIGRGQNLRVLGLQGQRGGTKQRESGGRGKGLGTPGVILR